VGHFLPGLAATQHARVTGLVSGHPDKAKKVAAQFGVPESAIYSYQDYERMRDNPEIDAVYIGLPNSMHAEYTVRAAKVGKHVLCEKPMATSIKDSQEMIDACKAANRKLMIAYRCQLEPTNLHAIQLIRSGAIGKVQMIESTNGFNIQPGEWRLTRELGGGGPLMDVGIYSLNACRYLTGEEPAEIQAMTYTDKSDPRFKEVEENLAWNMRFPSGVLASCITTYGANMDGAYRVYGSKGMIELSPAFAYEGIQMTVKLQHQPTTHDDEQEKDPAQFTREADYFADCVMNDRSVKMSGEEGLRDMQWMAKIYKAAGLPYLS
jgi:predicted dehydrogenase